MARNAPSRRRTAHGMGVALSPEGRGVFPDQSVRENLLLGAYSHRAIPPTKPRPRWSASLIRFPRLSERQDQFCRDAVRRRAADARDSRALMSEPKLLLLDEPSLGLAPLVIRDIFSAIRAFREEGLTILLVEQMANQALGVADRAYVLETGSVTLRGKGSDLLKDPEGARRLFGALIEKSNEPQRELERCHHRRRLPRPEI